MENEIKKYFERPDINKSGFCSMMGTSSRYLNMCLNDRGLNNKLKADIEKQLESQIEAAQNLLSYLQKG